MGEQKRRRILVLEDDAARIRWFKQTTIGMVVDYAATVRDALEFLARNTYTQIFLDHDLTEEHYLAVMRDATFNWTSLTAFDHETGFAVAKYLGENPECSPGAEIVVHTMNPSGGARMARELHKGRRRYRHIPYPELVRLSSRY